MIRKQGGREDVCHVWTAIECEAIDERLFWTPPLSLKSNISKPPRTPPFTTTLHLILTMSRSMQSNGAGPRRPGDKEGESALSA